MQIIDWCFEVVLSVHVSANAMACIKVSKKEMVTAQTDTRS